MAGATKDGVTATQYDAAPDHYACETLAQLMQTLSIREIAKLNNLKNKLQLAYHDFAKGEDPDLNALTISMALGTIST